MTADIFASDTGSITIGGTAHAGEVRDISVSAAGRDVTEVRGFGGYCTGFATPPGGPVSTTITAVMKDGVLAHLAGSPTLNDYGANTGIKYPIVYRWFDVTDSSGAALQIRFASAWITNIPSIKNATDNYVELEMEAKCLTKDFHVDYSANRVTTPLPS